MGGTRRTWKALDLFKSNNDGRTSLILSVSTLGTMEISLRKSQMLITWYPRRVRYLREFEKDPKSIFCAVIKSHCPVQFLLHVIFIGCLEKVIFTRWCIYWWRVWEFAAHCISGFSGIQTKILTLVHLGKFTCKWNSINLTKLIPWWDAIFFSDEVSIYFTVDNNIFYTWLGAVDWVADVINTCWQRQRTWQAVFWR